jgi:hypothetical protein
MYNCDELCKLISDDALLFDYGAFQSVKKHSLTRFMYHLSFIMILDGLY